MKARILSLLLVLLSATTINCYDFQPRGHSHTTDLIRKLKPTLDSEIATIHSKYIDEASEKWHLPKELIVSIAFKESEFNSCAISSKGAIGVMQVLPTAHKEEIKKRRLLPGELFLLKNNYDLGSEILYKLLKNHSLDSALSHYVGGPHPTYVADVRRNMKKCLL
jgi:soluble lytic murein transglycosylase-like protein